MKVALVTGGTKGIGLAVAQALLKDGYHLGITASSQASIDQAQSALANLEDKVICKLVDVRDYAAQHAFAQELLSKWGSIDVLIANAGVGHFAPIDELSAQQWNDVIDINLTGVFNSVKSCVDALKVSKGYIISIASLAGTNFFERGAAYNASKFGLVGFSQAIMLDLRKYGVKVTTIMPGSVSTYFNNHTPSEKDAWKIQPEDIARLVTDLLHMPARTLPSKIEVRPSIPPSAK